MLERAQSLGPSDCFAVGFDRLCVLRNVFGSLTLAQFGKHYMSSLRMDLFIMYDKQTEVMLGQFRSISTLRTLVQLWMIYWVNMTEAIPDLVRFKTPDIYAEHGEFDRVRKEFGFDGSVLMHLAKENGKIIVLTDEAWSELENTPSYEIEEGDWETVAYHAKAHSRDYMDLRKKLTSGISVDAPIVIKVADRLHLVSGNTRLMVSKALGLRPHIYFFEVATYEA